MRRLLAKHRTEMVYAGHATQSINELRLLPRSHARQTVELAHIVVTPPTTVYRHMDVFGNEVAWFQLEARHDRLIVESHALVTVAAGMVHESLSWERTTSPTIAFATAMAAAASASVTCGVTAFITPVSETAAGAAGSERAARMAAVTLARSRPEPSTAGVVTKPGMGTPAAMIGFDPGSGTGFVNLGVPSGGAPSSNKAS